MATAAASQVSVGRALSGVFRKVGELVSLDHLQQQSLGVKVPACDVYPMAQCFKGPEFSVDPQVETVHGPIIQPVRHGHLTVCRMGKFPVDLIYAALMKVPGAWQEDAAEGSSAIIRAGIHFSAKQIEYLIENLGVRGCRFRLADDDHSNYFPMIGTNGQICFLDLFEPFRADRAPYRVEIFPYSDLTKCDCEEGDRLFLRNPIND
jgi:hypothetical protein